MTRKLEVSPAEKLQRDRWHTVAVALGKALDLSNPDFGDLRITPESLSDETERQFREWLAPVLSRIVVEPLQAALRADSKNAGLVSAYANEDMGVAPEYIEMRDVPTGESLFGQCEYFALCVNLAEGVVRHVIMGEVTCCARCAALTGQELLIPTWAV